MSLHVVTHLLYPVLTMEHLLYATLGWVTATGDIYRRLAKET